MKIELNKKYKKDGIRLICLIDKEDYPLLKNYNWFSHKEGKRYYAYTNTLVGCKKTCIKMHRMILGQPPYSVDHIDGNGLNNRKNNLRKCNHSQNAVNSGVPSNNVSGFRGVCYDKTRLKWVAFVKKDNKNIFRKRFNTKEEAIVARKREMFKYFGNYYNPQKHVS
jgi:hypothetical protein